MVRLWVMRELVVSLSPLADHDVFSADSSLLAIGSNEVVETRR